MKPFKIVLVYCLMILALFGTIQAALINASTLTMASGPYAGAPSFTIWAESGNYYAKNDYGQLVYSGTNATTIIQNAVDGAESNGTVTFQGDKFFLSGYISIAKPLQLIGQGRWSTIFVADGFDAFRIGASTGDEFGGVQSLYMAHIGIWGKEPTSNRPPYGYADTVYSTGAGIRFIRGFQIVLDDLLICRKEYAIAFDANAGGNVYFVSMNNLSWEYNYYGVYKIGGGLGIVYLTNSQSYLNQRNGLYFIVSYSGMINQYVSEADGWNFPDNTGELVALSSPANIYAHGLHIQGSKSSVDSPASALLAIYPYAGSQIYVSDFVVQSTAHKGIIITGGSATVNSTVTLTNFVVGSTGNAGFMGDSGLIGDWGISSNAYTILSFTNGYVNATYGISISNEILYHRSGLVVNGENQSDGWIP